MKVNLSKFLISMVVATLLTSLSVCAAFADVTWDPNNKSSVNVYLSDENMTATVAGLNTTAMVTEGKSSDKWYCEFEMIQCNTALVGVVNSGYNLNAKYMGTTADSYSYFQYGLKYNNSIEISYGETYKSGDTIGLALDLNNRTLEFYKNGVSQGIAYNNLSGVLYPAVSSGGVNGYNVVKAKFKKSQFKYDIPKGFMPYDTSEPVNTEESITIESATNEIQVGKTFTTDVVLHNATNICAEDIAINYNSELFEYLGYEDLNGFKVYKEMADSAKGSVRLIVASKGKDFAINGEKIFVKLKFRAKKQGTGVVDSATARIADNGTVEKDLKVEFCGEKTIVVKGIKDVNRSGFFTLLDLGIDAWYHGLTADSTDKTKHDADVVVDNTIDDLDLSTIVEEMLMNTEYKPHNL